MTLTVISVRQIDGVRLIALDAEDRRAVRRDRAMLDHVTPLACLDIDGDGRRTWGMAGEDTPAGRAAIKAYLAGADE